MPDNNGWNIVRDWDNDRIIEGVITKEVRDLQGDIVPVGLVEAQMDWIGKNGALIYEHANDPKRGVVPLGKLLAWKRVGDEIHARWGIHKGSRIIDDIWTNEMKPLGTRAGFSIGGAIFDKTCRRDASGQVTCAVKDLEVIEVSWTPRPANQSSYLDYIAEFAKELEERLVIAMTKSEKDEKKPEDTAGQAAGALMTVLPLLLSLEDDYKKDMMEGLPGPESASPPSARKGEPVKKPDAHGNFTPPPSGSEYSEHQKKILREAYSSCRRQQGGSEKPSDKAHCAKIAWGAVHNASKDAQEAGGEAVDKKPEDLEGRLQSIYKDFVLKDGEVLDGGKLVFGCGTCADYATNLVRMGKSVPQALIMTENIVNGAMGANSKKTSLTINDKSASVEKATPSGELTMSPPPAGTPSEPQKPVNEIEDLKKRIAQLEAAFSKWMQSEQNEPAHQQPAGGFPGKQASSDEVATGTGPLKGVPTTTPEDIDRKKNKTTKEMSEGEMIDALMKKGYNFSAIHKGSPDNTVPGSDPVGSQRLQKNAQGNDPLKNYWNKEVI